MAVEQLLSMRVDILISWGTAAGLSPEVCSGDIIIPESVKVQDTEIKTDPSFTKSLIPRLPKHLKVHQGSIVEVNRLLPTVASKQQIFRDSQCLAADMESGGLATLAAKKKVHFAVIRSVLDPVTMPVPGSLLNSLTPQGELQLSEFLKNIVKNPGDLPLVFNLAWSFKKAHKALQIITQILNAP